MKTFYRPTIVLATVTTASVVLRTAIPPILTWLASFAFRKIPGIRVRVRRVRISFLAPGLTISGISLAAPDFPGNRIEAGGVAFNRKWKDLL
jgi:amino acid permease